MATFRGGEDPDKGNKFAGAEELQQAVNDAEQYRDEASTSAAAAAASASEAATSETNAAASEAAAAASYDSFDDRYLGAKASDPTLDNDGDALLTGALYFNTTTTKMRIYNGTSWDDLASAQVTNYEYTASASQTSFTGADDNTNVLSIPAAYEPLVYLNGIKLQKTVDYTYSTTAVTLVNGAALNDVLEVVVLGDFVVQEPVDGTEVMTYTYIASASQTAFNSFDDNSNIMLFDADAEVMGVYLNGVKLRYGASHDYTLNATTDTVTLSTGATAGDVIDVMIAKTFTVTSAMTQAQADARYLNEDSNLSDLANAATARTNLGVAIGSDVQAHSALLDQYASGLNRFTGKNLIQNGGMAIWQRSGIGIATHTAYTYDCNLDRWSNGNDMATGQWTSQQSQNAATSSYNPLGYYTLLACSTANASPGAGDTAGYSHQINSREAWATLRCGTAEAATVTLSFWHAHSQTGTWSLSFRNAASPVDRSYVVEYTQAVADTWEKTTVTLTMDTDTSATWDQYPADQRYISVYFCLRAGTTHATSTLDQWQTGNYTGSSNQVNFFSSTANRFRLSQVQLELGSEATDFEYFGGTTFTEYQACQQYLTKINGGPIGHGYAVSATQSVFKVTTPVQMRGTNPTILHQSGTTATFRIRGNGGSIAATTVSVNYIVTGGVDIYLNCAGGLTTNQTYHWDDNGAVVFLRSEI